MMSLSVFTARATVVFSIGSNFGLALVRDLGRLQLLLVDARGLRHLRQQHGLGGLLRAGHRGQHARARVLERNLLEVRRQGRRGERPRAREVRAPRTSARRRGSRPGPVRPMRNTSLSVLLTHSSFVPPTGCVARLARQQDQLRRRRADEHRRHLAPRRASCRAAPPSRPSSSRRPAASRSSRAACRPAPTVPSRRSPSARSSSLRR